VDYYQGVVLEYLRADRSVFVNTECCIQLNAAANPDASGTHWYCDAVAVDFRQNAVFLCEVSYSKSLGALLKRLEAWHTHWSALKATLVRDCSLPHDWPVRPWLFIPEDCITAAVQGIKRIGADSGTMLDPLITPLELVVPWRYTHWNRRGEGPKPDSIPMTMRA
jgi:hypothetical protein